MANDSWKSVASILPREGQLVETFNGTDTPRKLIRKGRLWFTSDMKMHVYYTPEYWREL